MSTPATGPVAATAGRIERAAGKLAASALKTMEARYGWYADLSADERSWVGFIAQAGIAAFVDWYTQPGSYGGHVTADVFGSAPRELTGSITLAQSLELIRSVVDVVEEHVDDLAVPGEEAELALAIMRYSREIAFSLAGLYADAAESRGAWDARLESLVVDAVLRGEADDELSSRAAALGWGQVSPVAVVVAAAPPVGDPLDVDQLRRGAGRAGAECLLAVQGRRVVLVLGGVRDPLAVARSLVPSCGDGPVVVGPVVPHLFAAGRSARAALSGFRAAAACPGVERPCSADDLLAERALAGDAPARRTLVDTVHTPLAADPGLRDTVEAYLRTGRSLEASARELFVHANTIRYRLGKAGDLIGYDVTMPRDAFVVQIALALGRLAEASAWRRPPARDDGFML